MMELPLVFNNNSNEQRSREITCGAELSWPQKIIYDVPWLLQIQLKSSVVVSVRERHLKSVRFSCKFYLHVKNEQKKNKNRKRV